MDIFLNSSRDYSFSFLKEKMLPTLTDQQKKIVIIASFALGCLVACIHIARWWMKNESSGNDKNNQQQFPLNEPLKPVDSPLPLTPPQDDKADQKKPPLNDPLPLTPPQDDKADQKKLPLNDPLPLTPPQDDKVDQKKLPLNDPLPLTPPQDDKADQKKLPLNDPLPLTPPQDDKVDQKKLPLNDPLPLTPPQDDKADQKKLPLNDPLPVLTPHDWNLLQQLHGDAKQSSDPMWVSKISLENKLKMAKQVGRHLLKLSLKKTELTNEQLQEVATACPNLKMLDLSDCYNITDAVKGLPKDLKELNLNYCDQINNEIKHLPKGLKKLYLGGCVEITDTSIENLSPDLEELDLTYCGEITDEVIKKLPKDLKKLNLTNCKKLTVAILKDLPKDIQLDLTNCNKALVCGWKAVEDNNNPDKIALKEKQLENELAMAKTAGKSLEELSFENKFVTDKQLQEVLNACPNLKKLDLTDCTLLSDAIINSLPTSLEQLNLCCIGPGTGLMTSAVIKYLPRGLKKLVLEGWFELEDAAIKDLPPTLDELDLSYCDKLTPSSLKDLPKGLKKLDLN